MITAIIIFSFLLDGIIATTLQSGSFFLPLFSLLSLVLIYPYFNTNKNMNFLIVAGLIGSFFDIVYMNSLFLNTLIYILIAYAITKMFSYLPINIANTYAVSLSVIILYRVLIFLFFSLIRVIPFDLIGLFNSIVSSILANAIYIFLGYLIINLAARRFKIKKITKI